ncbi:TVP38/TMEM64 family protein [Halonatronomonas betaini]|nr:TVP38/TMEM64 family protein [Halonatronomonas betaini]
MKFEKKKLARLIIILVSLATAILLIRLTGLNKYISIDNIELLQKFVADFGILAPLAYLGIWVLACILFLPGLPVTILGAFLFEPVFAIIYTSIGSTLGASSAFILGRYAARDLVTSLISNKEMLQKIDSGVEKHGWRMLIVTRMVPLFPFNLQNYIYGLTSMKLKVYAPLSWICMLPATVAYILAASSIYRGEGDLTQTFIYLGLAGVIFFILSLIPRLLKNRGYIQNEDDI